MKRIMLFTAGLCTITGAVCLACPTASAQDRPGPPDEPSPGLTELRKLKARLHLPKNGPSYCYLGYTEDTAGGYVTDVRPGILRLLRDEPQIKRLILSASVGEKCYRCPDRLPFNDEVLKDLPLLTHITSLDLRTIDLRDPRRYAFVQPLMNLEELRFENCAVDLHDLFTKCSPHPELKELLVKQRGKEPFEPLEDDAAEAPPVVTAAQMRRFVEGVPNLEELNVGIERSTRLEHAAVKEFAKLKKLKRLVITGSTYGPIPSNEYPPEVIERIEALQAWLKEQLPEAEEVRIARGLIDWPGLGLPTPTVPECDCDPEPPCSTGSGADENQRRIEDAELRQLLRDLKRGEEVVAEMRERSADPRLVKDRLKEVFAVQEHIKEFFHRRRGRSRP